MAGLHFCTSHENWNNFGLVWLPLWWSELFLTVLIERNISTNIAHWNIHSHDLHKNVCLCDNERNLMLCMFSKQSWHGEFLSNYVISWQLTPFVVFFLKLCTPYDDTQSCNFYVSFHKVVTSPLYAEIMHSKSETINYFTNGHFFCFKKGPLYCDILFHAIFKNQ